MEKTCLRCHYFKVEDLVAGVCRLQKGVDAPRPMKKLADTCESWRDCGQQYFIRQGWLTAEQKKAAAVVN